MNELLTIKTTNKDVYHQINFFDSLADLATVRDHHCLLWSTALTSNSLNFSKNFVTCSEFAKHHMLAIKMWSLINTNEELRSICVWACVSHGQTSKAGVLSCFSFETLICKLFSINRLSTCSIALGEVTT
jgi:hypothetical protein